MAGPPIFPGGTSVSHLRVYDWPAPDAPGGSGSPHLHTTSTEAYIVLSGQGRVETLGPDGFASHELTPGRIVWFSPGVVHRAVNDGGLEVLVLMSNAGLPESGDAVLTFPPQVLASSSAYRDAVTLPQGSPRSYGPAGPDADSAREASGVDGVRHMGSPSAGGIAPIGVSSASDQHRAGSSGVGDVPMDLFGAEADMAEDEAVARAARARRDLALEGYARLREAVDAEGPVALESLYRAASRLVADPAGTWRNLWTTTVARAAADTDRALDLLSGATTSDVPRLSEQAGEVSNGRPARLRSESNSESEPLDAVGHLMLGAVATADARTGPRRYGMCGRLRTWSTR